MSLNSYGPEKALKPLNALNTKFNALRIPGLGILNFDLDLAEFGAWAQGLEFFVFFGPRRVRAIRV